MFSSKKTDEFVVNVSRKFGGTGRGRIPAPVEVGPARGQPDQPWTAGDKMHAPATWLLSRDCLWRWQQRQSHRR